MVVCFVMICWRCLVFSYYVSCCFKLRWVLFTGYYVCFTFGTWFVGYFNSVALF